jgi:regulator of protease activity HflC (stomatin/prohibitin superfamily)
MSAWTWTAIVLGLLAATLLVLAIRVVKQYERGVVLRLGRLHGTREPGLRLIVPVVDVMHRVSLRIVTMPIQSQGIITRDNVSVDVSAVAYFRVVDAVRSVLAIENVHAAINQIAQTTLRKVVGQHTLDETLHDHRVGRRGHARRAQGHPAARDDEAGDGAPGRGGAGEAREDHQRRGRAPRGGQAG